MLTEHLKLEIILETETDLIQLGQSYLLTCGVILYNSLTCCDLTNGTNHVRFNCVIVSNLYILDR